MHLFSYFDVRAEFSWQWESCSWCLLLRLMAAALSGDIAWANRTLVQGLFAFVISYLLSTSINRVLLKSTSPVWSNFWLVPGCLQWAARACYELIFSRDLGWPPSWGELNPSAPSSGSQRVPISRQCHLWQSFFSFEMCVGFFLLLFIFFLFWQCAWLKAGPYQYPSQD